MLKTAQDHPAVYVGTYRKYNNGSLRGAWVNLSEFSTQSEFYDHIQQLHADEDDPEYMFQDYENFPSCFYGESWLDERLWVWLNLDADNRKICTLYFEQVNQEGTIEDALENFRGEYDSKESYAREFLDDCGSLSGLSEELRWFFDFEAYTDNLEISGDVTFVEQGGSTLVFSA